MKPHPAVGAVVHPLELPTARIAVLSKGTHPMFIRLLALAGVFHGVCAAAASLIAPGTYLIEGEAAPNRQPDGNSTIIVAPTGLIVFDTGRHKEHAQQVLDFARAQNRPIAAIINSHWHLDHVGGNPLLRAAFPDIRVYASSAIDAARQGFLADYRAQLLTEMAQSAKNPGTQESMRAEIALIDQGAALGPTDVIAKSAPVTIAGRDLQLHLESHAVTAGDVWVFDPDTRVLLAGDLVTLPAPLFESACPARWRTSLAHLEKEPFDWLVPGHGAPMHKPEFKAYRKAFSNLLDCAAGTASKKDCIDGWISDASVLLVDSKGMSYARTLVGYYLDNYLRHPTERIRKFCTG
jgi:glyoxylase-like metal-dependent hydrolase (beta-lactamase superfamily II)